MKEVLALMSPGNLDIFSTSPLFLAATCLVHMRQSNKVLSLFALENLEYFNGLLWRLAAGFY